MTKVTVKSAEVAKAIVAMIMPKATAENVGLSIGGKVQNRFYNDAASGNSYCEAYADDCTTLEKINIFDSRNNIVATIEVDSADGQAEISAEQVAEIENATGLKVTNAVSAENQPMNIEFDAAKLAQEETAVNAELNEWVAEMVTAMKKELAETEVALKKLEVEIAANGATVKSVAMKAAYEAEIEEMKRNLENYVVTDSAVSAAKNNEVRKEIPLYVYNHFQALLEKISNGQRVILSQ